MYLDNEFKRLLADSKSPIILPRMKNVLNFINNQITHSYKKQPCWNGYRTQGFELIYNTIYKGGSYLDGKISDFEKLYSFLNFERQVLSRSFDSSRGGGNVYRKHFIDSSSCKEFIFSVVPRDCGKSYPLDKGETAWKRYRAFRMIDHDTSDQSLNISSGLLHYKHNPPHFAIFTFDPVAAILQYSNLKHAVSLEDYIHQYLIMPALTLDNQRLWLMGIYSEWFSTRSRSYVDIPMVTTNYSRIPSNLDNALRDISSLIDNSRNNNIGMARLLSSFPLPYHTNIPKYAKALYNKSSVDDISEYDWGTFMIYRRMLDISVRALGATINSQDSQTDIYRLRRIINLLQNASITSPIHDSYTKHFVKQSINTLHMQSINLYNSINNF